MAIEIGTIDDRMSEFETFLGHPMTYYRDFHSASQTASPPGPSYWTALASAVAAGRWVHVSFRPAAGSGPTFWDQVAGGSEDARWTSIGNYLGNTSTFPAHSPYPHLWTFQHEPENDESGGSIPSAASFTSAFNRVASIIKPLAPQWRACMIYMTGTFYFGPDHGGPTIWWPTQAEVLGQDYYNRRGANDASDPWADLGDSINTFHPRNLYSTVNGKIGAYQYAQQLGVPFTMPEVGMPPRNPATGGGVAAVQQDRANNFLQVMVDEWKNLPDFWGINWYDRDTGDNYPNYAIGGGSGTVPACDPDPYTLAVFNQFTQGATGTSVLAID